jgi:Tol biopolymer transport system component
MKVVLMRSWRVRENKSRKRFSERYQKQVSLHATLIFLVVLILAWFVPAGADITTTPTTGITPTVSFTNLPSNNPNQIAFSSSREDPSEIYIMNPDGTGVRRLTNNLGSNDYVGSWSPDGTKIVFYSHRDGNWEIYVINADGTNQIRLTNTSRDNTNPDWSFDGSKIVYSSGHEREDMHIFIMKTDGTGQTQITNGSGYDRSPAWSPDGRKIVFSSNRDGNESIYVMNADGSAQTRLTSTSSDIDPAWSPDGTKIAFSSYRDSTYKLYVMNADGSGQVRLTNTSVSNYDPSWSPDGKRIAFSSSSTGKGDIYVINADGSNPVQLTNDPNADFSPSWNNKNYVYVPPPPPLSVTAISPASGTNDGTVSATVTGTGFKSGAVVKLKLVGQPDILASGVTLTGDSLITCTFDLTGKATGIWDLAVTNPSDGTTSIRSTAFTLTTLPIITNTTGTIIVSTTPSDALVYLDGSLKGTGAVTIQDVSPGYHTIRVSKSLYNDYVTDVRVAAGTPSYVYAALTPVTGNIISGTIIASSNPAGANVYLDGTDKGISPVTIINVSPGIHTVSFTKTGYTAASQSVTITADQTTSVTVDLTRTGWNWGDWMNTTTLFIAGIVVAIIAIIGYLIRKKKNRWEG